MVFLQVIVGIPRCCLSSRMNFDAYARVKDFFIFSREISAHVGMQTATSDRPFKKQAQNLPTYVFSR
jgi:hypothetical protein